MDDVSAVARWYARFHGRPGDVVSAVVRTPRELGDLGELVAVMYRTPGGELREHPFMPHARPVLARDERGGLHVLGGAYTTTERGIVDMNHPMQRYADPRARFTPQGVPIHGLTTPGEGVAVVRHNPVDLVMDGLQEAGRRAGAVTVTLVTAGVTQLVTDAAIERTPFSDGWRVVAQAAAGIVPGIVALPHHPAFGTGLIVGATSGALTRFVRTRGWDQTAARWLEALLPHRSASGVDVGSLPFRIKVEARAA